MMTYLAIKSLYENLLNLVCNFLLKKQSWKFICIVLEILCHLIFRKQLTRWLPREFYVFYSETRNKLKYITP